MWISISMVGFTPNLQAHAEVSTQSQESKIDEALPATGRERTACAPEQDPTDPWLDRTHAYLNTRLCAPAVWFDDFFGDERSLEDPGASTFIRLRTYATWSQKEGWGTKANVRGSVRLPHLSNRVRLLLTGDPDEETDPTSVVTDLDDDTDNTNLGLRFLLGDGDQGRLDLDGTVRISGGNLNPRAVLRYERIRPLSEHSLLRSTQQLSWERIDGAGAETRLDWEWQPTSGRVWRWSNKAGVLEKTAGVPWRTALTGFRRLNDRTALSMEAGLNGQTRPNLKTEKYFAALRFRRQFARPWLFYEVEPQYAYRTQKGEQEAYSDWGLTLTLEVQFRSDGRY